MIPLDQNNVAWPVEVKNALYKLIVKQVKEQCREDAFNRGVPRSGAPPIQMPDGSLRADARYQRLLTSHDAKMKMYKERWREVCMREGGVNATEEFAKYKDRDGQPCAPPRIAGVGEGGASVAAIVEAAVKAALEAVGVQKKPEPTKKAGVKK